MMSRDAMRAIDRAAAAYAASQSDPIGAYHAYLAGALAALQQVRADLLALSRPGATTAGAAGDLGPGMAGAVDLDCVRQ